MLATSAAVTARCACFAGASAWPALISSSVATPYSSIMFSSVDHPQAVIAELRYCAGGRLSRAKRNASMFQMPATPIAMLSAKAALFPVGVEHRLVRLRHDRAEAVHAAHVRRAVHGISSGCFGKPGADHAVARDQIGELLLAPAFGAGGAHRQHQIAQSRRSNPTRGFRCPSAARRRTRAARRADRRRRASGRAPICTRAAAGRAPPTDNRSTTCRRPCCALPACSPARPDDCPSGRR